MRKSLIALALGIFSTVCASAQESGLKPFKVDVSLGYAIPGGDGAKGGVLFAIEPKYAIMPSLALGLRIEAAVMARSSGYDSNGGMMDTEVKAAGSYVLTGDYYFSQNYSFRPFVGAGAGLYSVASASVEDVNNNGEANVSASNKLGGLVRAGAEIRHFRIGVEYNLIGNTSYTGFDQNGASTKLEAKNGYLGIKLGFCFGGGPR